MFSSHLMHTETDSVLYFAGQSHPQTSFAFTGSAYIRNNISPILELTIRPFHIVIPFQSPVHRIRKPSHTNHCLFTDCVETVDVDAQLNRRRPIYARKHIKTS